MVFVVGGGGGELKKEARVGGLFIVRIILSYRSHNI